MKPLRRRNSLRAPGFDYATPGAYFVTVVAEHRAELFGRIRAETIDLTPAGAMLHELMLAVPDRYARVELDYWVVMPNHVHAVLWLNHPQDSLTLSAVLDWYKTQTTNAYIDGVKRERWPRFDGHVWQRGFYDHIVRSEKDLHRIRKYISENPERWLWDHDNPAASDPEEDLVETLNREYEGMPIRPYVR